MTVHVVYDGLCLFCIRSLRVVRRFDRHGVLELHDATERERVLAEFPMLRDADLDAEMFVIDADGRAYGGFYAFRRLAGALPALRPLWVLAHIPGVAWTGERVYAMVARNRRRLGCRVA